MSLKIKLRGTAECLMCRQRWLRIKCAFTHTNCKVLQQQQLPLLCSVRQCLRCSVTCQPSMAADQFMVLQELAAQAALGRFVLLALFLRARAEAWEALHPAREKGWTGAHEQLHMMKCCTVLEQSWRALCCTAEKGRVAARSSSLSPRMPIVQDYCAVKPFWKINGVLDASPSWWIWEFPPVKITALAHKFSCSADPSLCHVCWKGDLKETARKVSSL